MTTTTTRPAPVADWVTINDLYADPYPIFRRMREEAPVHWVPAVNRYMVVSYDACHTIEQDPDRFTAREQGSLMYKAMGHSMLRKDDPEHAVERAAYGGVLKPRAIKESWTSVFEANTEKYIAHLKEVGSGADLIRHFAAPFAAANLVEILGTLGADWHDMERWSQHMIDGTGNYADDPEVWARALTARDEVETMIDELAPHYRANPDHTLLSHLVNSPRILARLGPPKLLSSRTPARESSRAVASAERGWVGTPWLPRGDPRAIGSGHDVQVDPPSPRRERVEPEEPVHGLG